MDPNKLLFIARDETKRELVVKFTKKNTPLTLTNSVVIGP